MSTAKVIKTQQNKTPKALIQTIPNRSQCRTLILQIGLQKEYKN